MQQFLSDAARALASARSVRAALKRVARAVVPRAADFCLIFLVRDNDVHCVAAAHASAAGQRLLHRFVRVYAIKVSDPVSTVAHVVRTGRPRLRSEIHTEGRLPVNARPALTLHRQLAPCSALVVPIGGPPRVLGAISLSYAASGRRYAAPDVASATRLAHLAEQLVAKHAGAVAVVDPALNRRPLRVRART